MRNALLATCLVAAGMTSSVAISAQTERDRIHTLEITTTEEFFPVGVNSASTSIHVADIDSIEFRTELQILKVIGYKRIPYYGTERNVTAFDLSKVTGLEFTYLKDGKLPSPSLYGQILVELRNTAEIRWCPIAGAAGYEIRAFMRDMSDTSIIGVGEILASATVGADSTSCILEGLPYSTDLYFQVRALSPKGEAFNSEWSTRTNFRHERFNYFALTTQPRYEVPEVISRASVGYDSITVKINLEYDSIADTHGYAEHFEISNGQFVADKLIVEDTSDGSRKEFVLTDSDKKGGEFTVRDLKENTRYLLYLINSNIRVAVDAPYNQLQIRTKGHPGEPVVLSSGVISHILNSDGMNDGISDGQIYYLHGGEEYILTSIVDVQKGFRLATLPEDVIAGKRAKVFVNNNFMFGRNGSSEDFTLSSLVFENIDFDVEGTSAFDSGTGSATGNYFINRYSVSGAFTLDSLVMKNCSFQHFVRGFIRDQGQAVTRINNLIVENNDFYNCGAYDRNGRGYAWVQGKGDPNSNLFLNLIWRNNTIYNSPRTALFTDGDKDVEFAEDIQWNITLENNTIVNFSTLSTARNLFQMRYVPGDSKITVKNNLFIQTKDEADTERPLNFSTMDIRKINGSGKMTFDIRDNYCNGSKDDGIVNGTRFSSTRNSAGMFPECFAEGMTAGDLVIKASGLEAVELMAAPNPPSFAGTPDAYRIANLDGLRYNDTEAVRNSEVFTKNIGASKWRELIGSK